MPTKRITKEEMLLEIAEIASRRSTCGRLKVGAVLTDEKKSQILSFGYNGNYSGGPNMCDSDSPGNCGCIHSEINALLKAESAKVGKVLFLTDSPCVNCAKVIINYGIKKVYYHREYRLKDGLDLLKKGKVKIKRIGDLQDRNSMV